MSEVQIRAPTLKDEAALTVFFDSLVESGDDKYFHPHDLTGQAAREICIYRGVDHYCVMVRSGKVIAYGMLRGWDEGYEVPSLGIAVAPCFRSKGAALALMTYLHFVASLRDCSRVMLKVYKRNSQALGLFESLGYKFSEHSDEMLIGMVDV